MDEREFKTAFSQVNERPCAFTKAVLTRCSQCSRAQRLLIAEREAVACHSPAGHDRCTAYLETLRAKALFALRLSQLEDKLPHGKEIKVQCGGARGLQSAMAPESPEQAVPDIDGLLQAAAARYGDIAHWPYPEIIRQVGHYEARRRRQSR